MGTEPGIKPAVSATRNGRIGVLATAATAASSRYQALVAAWRRGRGVHAGLPGRGGPDRGRPTGCPELRELVQRYTAPLREAQVDTVLLGCTHYPFIEALWHEALGPEIQLLASRPPWRGARLGCGGTSTRRTTRTRRRRRCWSRPAATPRRSASGWPRVLGWGPGRSAPLGALTKEKSAEFAARRADSLRRLV